MLRRTFLKGFGIASAALAVPAVLTTTSFNSPKKIMPIRLKGRVRCGSAGIAAVAVTDGSNIALTNAAGYYELQSTSASEFVYLSTPRGYAFPHQKGIAAFYQRIEAHAGVFHADFYLEKLEGDDSTHQFIVWADTQLKTKDDAQQLKNTVVPDLCALLASYKAGALFHGIGCGDLVWDRFSLFDDYKEAVQATGIPFFNVIGNHDLDLHADTNAFASGTFRKHFGPTYYSYNRGEIHYIILDDVFHLGNEKKCIGFLHADQLRWLEQDLRIVTPGTTVVVTLHIPTDTGLARRTGTAEDLTQVVSNRQQLYKLLAPFNAHILSGHTHVNEHWDRGNLMEHNHGTVCGAWWTGPICGDGTPMGYAVYEVKDSDIAWYYKSIGKPKEHQMRIYTNKKASGHQDEIIVNVWNWDPKWKVEWWEDNTPKGAMQQRVAYDPWAVELYGGTELPQKRPFVEPMLADHLFFATPSPQAKCITVNVTDRFGNIFTETAALQKDQVLLESQLMLV